jgi:glycine/D-amino acid oxidase-like deaminating enzyme
MPQHLAGQGTGPALRSGVAYWPQVNPPPPIYPPLEKDADCDVAIIGGGITGALTAFLLTDQGVDVLLVDKGRVAAGSTAASTALLQYEIDLHLCELAPRIGMDAAVRAYRLGWEAIRVMQDLVRRIDDPCGFEERSTLYLASSQQDVSAFRDEQQQRRRAGFDVELLTESDIADRWSCRSPAALLSRGNAQVDSVRLTRRLLEWSAAHGARVCEHAEVAGWDQTRHDSIRLTTTSGRQINARRLVFATGYESERYLGRRLGDLNSTFAVVTQPLTTFEGWADRCQIWESARPYFYLRSTPDGRAMMGGEDDPHPFAHGDDELLKLKAEKLVRRFRQMFPAIDIEVADAWAGTFGESRDGLPMIGPAANVPNAYFALGFGGNGMTHSVIAAQIIADLHLGRKNRDAELFRVDR